MQLLLRLMSWPCGLQEQFHKQRGQVLPLLLQPAQAWMRVSAYSPLGHQGSAASWDHMAACTWQIRPNESGHQADTSLLLLFCNTHYAQMCRCHKAFDYVTFSLSTQFAFSNHFAERILLSATVCPDWLIDHSTHNPRLNPAQAQIFKSNPG